MIAEQDAPLSAVDQLDRVFNAVAETYQELWLIRQIEMPDDILSESFTRLTDRIAALNRIAQEQASQHERDSRIRARAERVRLAAVTVQRRLAETTQIQPVAEVIVINNDPIHVLPPQVRQKRRPARKSIALKKTELDAVMPDSCSICMENYTRVNSVTTSCGHAFCKGCYDVHEQTGLSNRMLKVRCPLCRTETPKITEYRARKGGNQGFPSPLPLGGDEVPHPLVT